MIIGFIPASFAYLMGLAATYIILAIGLITSLAFFIEAVISVRKTMNMQNRSSCRLKKKRMTARQLIQDLPEKLKKKSLKKSL